MTTDKTIKSTQKPLNQRKIGLYAGLGILLMAFIAPFANFGVLAKLFVAGKETETLNNITASKGLFVAGIAGFIVVMLLDIAVSWFLYLFFKPISAKISALAGWFRVIYSAFFAYSIAQLIRVVVEVNSASPSGKNVLQLIASFGYIWQIGYLFFGVHLALIGYLAIKSKFMGMWIGVLLIIAGIGYFVDAFGILFIPNYNFSLAAFTFIGEVVFMFWLLFQKGKNLHEKLN